MVDSATDFHPIAIPSPNPTTAPGGPAPAAGPQRTPMSPPGSAIFSQSESDVDESPAMRYGSQEDASILYARPQRRHKTRTLSAVSRRLALCTVRVRARVLTRARAPFCRPKVRKRSCASATHLVRNRVEPAVGACRTVRPPRQAEYARTKHTDREYTCTDETSNKSRKFLVDVEETMKLVLEQEDTDANFQAGLPSAPLRRIAADP